MKTSIMKVVAQSDVLYIPSKKQEGGQLAKCLIRLRELGGQYEDEYLCALFGNLATDHNYRPEVEWKRFKTKLSSFDVRHLVWNIATRLGLGKGKVYSNDDCACYIERRFASLCVTASGEPLSHSTLRNLTVTSNSDQIHCDIQGVDGLLFHIPSQLGFSC